MQYTKAEPTEECQHFVSKMAPKKTQNKGSAASAAQKAADKKAREAQQKRAAEDERAREEEERRSEKESDGDAKASDHEEGAAGGSEKGSHEKGVTKEKANCSFSAKQEERLVEFFSVNPVFFDKFPRVFPSLEARWPTIWLGSVICTSSLQAPGTTLPSSSSWSKLRSCSPGQRFRSQL